MICGELLELGKNQANIVDGEAFAETVFIATPMILKLEQKPLSKV